MIRIRRLRAPLVRQHDSTDCGPAALLSILRFWGGDASLSRVRGLARTDWQGTTLLGLKGAAEALGLDARGVQAPYESLRTDGSFPCIVHMVTETGAPHYVVVYRLEGARAWLGDPARGRRRMDRRTFERRWPSRCALLLAPTHRLHEDHPPSWIGWVAGYFRQDATWLTQSLFLGVLGTTLGLVTAICIQQMIDRFIPERDVTMVLATGALLLLLLVVRIVLAHLRRRFLIRLNRSVSVRMNRDVLRHLFRLPLGFFESRSTGDLTVRLADGVRIQRALLDVLGTAVIDGLVVAGSLLFLFYLAPPFGALALAVVPLYAALLAHPILRAREGQERTMAAYSRLEASYVDGLAGIGEIVSLGAGRAFEYASARLFMRLQRAAEELGRVRSGISLRAEALGGGAVLLALVWGALMTLDGSLLVGELVAGYSLLAGMLPSVEKLVHGAASLQDASVAAHRLQDVLLAEPEKLEGGRSPLHVRKELRLTGASIELPSGRPILEGLEIALPRGRMTALSGPNGAGKSSVVRALARLVPLSSGALLVDGAPANDYELAEYRAKVTVLAGNPRIFRGTLAHNVLLGRSAAHRETLQPLLDSFALGDFLSRFPSGWDTLVGEGAVRLSGGEAQLLGFLRAVVTYPEVLLVDEALGATDSALSGILLDALTGYAARRCVLVVSHDPHVLCRAELLYWLEAGRVCCGGPPEAVLAEVAAPRPHGARFDMVNGGTRSSRPLARRPRTAHSGGPA